ncbi:WbqC-like protein [Winogradskyella wandonensis]|uniref:WbqC-like protein n=1 Tax=Winogradskyella wandonensis TaxID=1442586 RepID=A0A4R1KQF1_9FLAO|nr:WbqC family protein [Winogradskyella wandonensis]TCK66703.1 WbqC-like protein [Winogradskyella wandonensis]
MLLHPTYFPNIAHFAAMLQKDYFTLEICDNYQKQTFRNRCEIYGANGKLTLTVPVSYTQKQRQQYKDVAIFNNEDWQSQHLKSLDSAYRMSPFYEFYIDDLMPVFQNKFYSLLDLNLKSLELILKCLELDLNYSISNVFTLPKDAKTDYRCLVNAKKHSDFNFPFYTQVFTQKHGFISNLSILDILFNEGPNTLNYLERLTLDTSCFNQ